MVYGAAILYQHRKLVLSTLPLGETLRQQRRTLVLQFASARSLVLDYQVSCIHQQPKCWYSSRLTGNYLIVENDQRAWNLS